MKKHEYYIAAQILETLRAQSRKPNYKAWDHCSLSMGGKFGET